MKGASASIRVSAVAVKGFVVELWVKKPRLRPSAHGLVKTSIFSREHQNYTRFLNTVLDPRAN
jgi:hypothetical protein